MKKPSIPHWGTAALAMAALAGVVQVQATITVTIEAPMVENTTANILNPTATFVVETFEAPVVIGSYTTLGPLPIGTYNIDPGGLGTFEVIAADVYGGAGGTGQYLVNKRPLADNGGIRLDLGVDRYYFGMWWSAGSPDSVVLSKGGVPIFTFTTADVITTIGLLPDTADYYGNPDPPFNGPPRENSGEPYVFINFFADATMPFDSIYMKGDLIESDNHTVSSDILIPNGDPVVPEPGTGVMLLGGLLGAIGFVRRKAQA